MIDLPPDRAAESPILQAARALVEALRKPGCESPEVTLLLGDVEWRSLEAEHRRPYRPHASEVYMPVEGGGAVRFRRTGGPVGETISSPALTADEVTRLRGLLEWAALASANGLLPGIMREAPPAAPPPCAATFAGAKCAGEHGAGSHSRHRGQDSAGKWVEWSDGSGWTPEELARRGLPTVEVDPNTPPGEARLGPIHITGIGDGPPLHASGNGRLYEAKLKGIEFETTEPYPKPDQT